MNSQEIVTKITKARIQMLLNMPFFGSLILKLKIKPLPPGDPYGSMGTDGRFLYYGHKFVEDLPEAQLIGVLCHEVMHLALLHGFRRNNRNHTRWNIACDYAINWSLENEFHLSLPKGACIDEKYKDMAAEEIYALLPEESKMPQWGLILDPTEGKGGEGEGNEDIPAQSIAEQEVNWKAAIKTAIEMGKQAGKLPGSFIDKINEGQSQVNWRQQLARFMTGNAQTNYNWYPPHQLYLQAGIHIPTLNEPIIEGLTIAVDTSGSVNNKMLTAFFAEVRSLLTYKPTILQFDTQLHGVSNEFPESIKGRGGTDFDPPFEWAKENNTKLLLVLTDMYANFPDRPGFPVIWVRTSSEDAPYGEYIDLYTEA